MNGTLPDHLIIAPILIPFVAGALMLFYDDRARAARLVISLISTVSLLIVAGMLLAQSEGSNNTGGNDVGVYLLGNWPPPFTIVLVLDRLSALMLLLTACLALPALLFASAGWDRQGQHFHSLFQFLLMGLNGAFLTGDLFNLFVFFEVLLAASYGLLLHGSGRARVRSGLHYIAVNLVASLFFLVGVSLIYGVTGTLNMADLALKLSVLPVEDRPLVLAAGAILGVVFAVKAGMWPLSFWLPGAYMSAAAPVGAMFAVMTKVGLYVILRLSTLLFGADATVAAGFGAYAVLLGGLATMFYGMIGLMAAQGLPRVASFSVLISAGTILSAVGLGVFSGPQMYASALYYMMASTLAASALFLISELMEREQGAIATILAVTADAYGFGDQDPEDEPDQAEGGLFLTATHTILALSFAVITLILAGMPPLAGFLGKVGLITGALAGPASQPVPPLVWAYIALLILSGFATLVVLVRIGIHTFWAPMEEIAPRIRVAELVPIVMLIGFALLLTVEARPVMRYLGQTGAMLENPGIYIHAVTAEKPSTGIPLSETGNGRASAGGVTQ
ncbi:MULTISPECIES: monovalent cation/H+ antiporter subunit D [Haematobacter]|uniref:Monovalent cation/H+ antiporter subunit D n=1 Tax=Haematobacter genomosp. 1 TaxID=366618 RepID=A0A212A814_9RHOB|nr:MULTISPECIES: monovalent cation/H+ antiporter subunit D [Haematobacter]OWJ75461.1 monovalent cation/H+ antiporter subunit D [Haematobacter genomosp. 1]